MKPLYASLIVLITAAIIILALGIEMDYKESPITASSWSDYHTPQLVFDTTPKTYWESEPGMPQWIQVDWGQEQTITNYDVGIHGWDNAPRAWTLNGSNDQYTWVTVDIRPRVPWYDEGYQRFVVTSPGSYRYYRFTVIEPGPGRDFAILGELSFFGRLIPPA